MCLSPYACRLLTYLKITKFGCGTSLTYKLFNLFSNPSIYLELCFWTTDEHKSNIHSPFSNVFGPHQHLRHSVDSVFLELFCRHQLVVENSIEESSENEPRQQRCGWEKPKQ